MHLIGESNSAPCLQPDADFAVWRGESDTECQFGRRAAIDAPSPFVLSFHAFEGEKSFESPGMQMVTGGKLRIRSVRTVAVSATGADKPEAGQVNVVHVSSFVRNRKFLNKKAGYGDASRVINVAHSLFVFSYGLFPVPLTRHR